MKVTRSTLAVLIGAALLAGCASFDGLQPSARLADPAELPIRDSLARLPAAVAGWPSGDWWTIYADPQLDALMHEALTGSPTLAIARARVELADALAGAVDAGRLPQLDGDIDIQRQRHAEHAFYVPPTAGATLNTGQLAFNFKYEFDFWDRQRAALEAALSRARAVALESEAARLTLAVAMARSYVELEHQWTLLDLAESTLKQREQVRKLAELRFAAGLESKVELQYTKSAVFVARSDVAVVQERIALLKNELAALAGQGPDRGLEIVRPRLGAEWVTAVPAKLPAELLGRRPDIVAQRLRVEAAGNDIAAARGRFYPNINLTAFVGAQSVSLDRLLMSGSGTGGGGVALNLPIFDGGRLRANLAARNADFNLAVEQYNHTLVEALRDVADQVNRAYATDLQSAEQRQAQGAVEETYALALLRYRGKLTNYLTVLAVESQVLAQRRLGADLRARRLTVAINLVRALGGGFQGSTRQAD